MHQTIPWMQQQGFQCVWVAFSRNTRIRTTIQSKGDCIYHTYHGYPNEKRFEKILQTYCPDLIHLQGPIIYLALPFYKKYRLPLLIGFHFWTGVFRPNEKGGFDNKDILDNITALTLDPICQETKLALEFYVASDFINTVIASLGGQEISNVIYPIPPPEHYLVFKEGIKTQKYITIVNTNRGKGGDLFLEIVKEIKELPFLAICNEPNHDGLDEAIGREINGRMLPYSEMKEVYATTRILLIPSHVDETFSRVAYEGAANGILILTTGKGFISQLLGEAGIYLDEEDVKGWIEAIRHFYVREDLLTKYGQLLRDQVSKLGDQETKFNRLVTKLVPLSPKRNLMIFTPWCDQGLGYQSKLYSRLLRQEGYKVHIFSFLPYSCIDQDNTLQQDPSEWTDYDTLYCSYNTREEVTSRELRQFVLSRNIGLCLIPEICFSPIFEKVAILKQLKVKCYALPNIEICRKDELEQYKCFDRILCVTRQCYNVLKEAKVSAPLDYIGHCLPWKSPVSLKLKSEDPIKFLHVSGYNAITRKQTLKVLVAFKQALEIVGSRIALTVTFSRNIPHDAYRYAGKGITLYTEGLSHAQIKTLYQQHHVSIQVASHEGLGLGFYESLACHTPIISLDQAPHNEVIIEGRSGWLLPSSPFELHDNDQALVKGGHFNPEDLSDKIIWLACHPEEVIKVIATCDEEVVKWSPEPFIQRLTRSFDQD